MQFEKAYFEAAYGTSKQLPVSELPEIVFSGRSNVGKSSLINRLLNRKSLAKVSSTPGKTATINFYNIGDSRLVDLPGYGYAKVSHSEHSRWAELMDGYFASERDMLSLSAARERARSGIPPQAFAVCVPSVTPTHIFSPCFTKALIFIGISGISFLYLFATSLRTGAADTTSSFVR